MSIRAVRRVIGAAAIVAGALLIWLSPEVLSGILFIAAGFALEVLGIALEHR